MKSRIIKRIEQAPLALTDRVHLLLVRAGMKPAAQLDIEGERPTASNGYVGVLDRSRLPQVRVLLEELQVPYVLSQVNRDCVWEFTDGDATIVAYRDRAPCYVASTSALLERTLTALRGHDSREFGRCMGYPETAIQAFLGERQPFMGAKGGLFSPTHPMNFFTAWVQSKECLREELETARCWHDATRALSPSLYRAVVRFCEQSPATGNIAWRDTYWCV